VHLSAAQPGKKRNKKSAQKRKEARRNIRGETRKQVGTETQGLWNIIGESEGQEKMSAMLWERASHDFRRLEERIFQLEGGIAITSPMSGGNSKGEHIPQPAGDLNRVGGSVVLEITGMAPRGSKRGQREATGRLTTSERKKRHKRKIPFYGKSPKSDNIVKLGGERGSLRRKGYIKKKN